jgi:pimeloyl-ACP methyl ester carboxylesterase
MVEHGYAPADGTDIYWESRGSGGTPLVAVHGGFGMATMFGDVLDRLAKERRVVAIELRGHGHSRDDDRPFTFEGLGDQVAGVVTHLDLGPADLLGYSFGAFAVLHCAFRHPALVRRLVLTSIPCRRNGWFAEVLQGMDQVGRGGFEMMSQSPLYAAWVEVAPDKDAFPTLMDKTGDLLRQSYDWTDRIRSLAMPTMLVYGDADSIPPSHAAEFYGLLGGGLRDADWDGSGKGVARLAILPGRTHYDIGSSPELAEVVAPFLA